MQEFVFLKERLIININKYRSMTIRRLASFATTLLFIFSLAIFSSSCRGSKRAAKKGTKVKSGSGMGNSKQKNKHVWGK
jgi:hypothetical protein